LREVQIVFLIPIFLLPSKTDSGIIHGAIGFFVSISGSNQHRLWPQASNLIGKETLIFNKKE
jgi:hypothetical protein